MRRRLDVEMVRRGMVGSRSEAAIAIEAGGVLVGGRLVRKASSLVAPDEPVTVTRPPRRFASRGGEKLEAALRRFDIDVAGLQALDVGASTGGFTDCLLANGVSRVVALDVGYGQLDWRLRNDPRVVVVERTNARDLAPTALPFRPEFVAADVSFISLRLILPAVVGCAAPGAAFVLLVKPQFEAGAHQVGRGGVVSDPAVWRSVLEDIGDACATAGLRVNGITASPVLGAAGNAEFLLWADLPAEGRWETTGVRMGEWIDRATAEALDLRDRPQQNGRIGG